MRLEFKSWGPSIADSPHISGKLCTAPDRSNKPIVAPLSNSVKYPDALPAKAVGLSGLPGRKHRSLHPSRQEGNSRLRCPLTPWSHYGESESEKAQQRVPCLERPRGESGIFMSKRNRKWLAI